MSKKPTNTRTIKHQILTLAAATTLLALQSLSVNAEAAAVNAVNSSKVEFREVQLLQTDKGLTLGGKIKRRSFNTHVAAGHLDVVVKDSKGKVLHQTAGGYVPSLSLRKSRYGSSFSISIPGSTSLPKGSVVSVGYHKNDNSILEQAMESTQPAAHKENILL